MSDRILALACRFLCRLIKDGWDLFVWVKNRIIFYSDTSDTQCFVCELLLKRTNNPVKKATCGVVVNFPSGARVFLGLCDAHNVESGARRMEARRELKEFYCSKDSRQVGDVTIPGKKEMGVSVEDMEFIPPQPPQKKV